MNIDKLEPDDPRVSRETTLIRNRTYSYILSTPKIEPIATILLLHGFPDLAFGWRYQIPFLTDLGYQVVALDMLGFGRTTVPDQPGCCALRAVSEDMRELAKVVAKDQKIILGGHSMGGNVAWRVALWCPELVQGVFSISSPFLPPSKVFRTLDDVTKAGELRCLRYQLKLKGPEVEEEIQYEGKTRQFLNATYGGLGPNNEVGFTAGDGVLLDRLPVLNRSHLVSNKELDHYVAEYSRCAHSSLRGPLNWYRTRTHDYLDELRLLRHPIKFSMPALFLSAAKDDINLPTLAKQMDQYFDDLDHGEVQAGHWAHWESPLEVNQQIAQWLEKVVEYNDGERDS
ncbi:epoxide hydrolase [Fusarium albosuccineum]|uniref:Epoxide hydrolase n=1 Tax=Fusarium albosuccineum TaxID=1237068 RepID=A0A8H4KZQ9_9HYPO|nr:epoxide hydrolase [Fusarium albosuccineum]